MMNYGKKMAIIESAIIIADSRIFAKTANIFRISSIII